MPLFQSILVHVDAENPDRGTLAQASGLLASGSASACTLVDTVPEFAWTVRAFMADHRQVRESVIHDRQTRLEALAQGLRASGGVAVKVLSGETSEALILEAQSGKHDLVMKVAKGPRSRRGGFFGSTGLRLLHKCPCAVWLTPPGRDAAAQNVLALVDASPEDENHKALNGRILAHARGVCEESRLHVAYAWELYGANLIRVKMPADEFKALHRDVHNRNRASFDELLAEFGLDGKGGRAFLEEGDPVDVVPRLVAEKKVDLVVMGSVSRAGIAGLLIGNTAEALFERLECGLLVIKPQLLGNA